MKSTVKRGVQFLRRLLGTDILEARLNGVEANPLTSSRHDASEKVLQILLANHYRSLAGSTGCLRSLADVEFRTFSQNGEDGILLFLFALLGSGRRRVVEICAGDGVECNAANLIINHGWTGLLFDGDASHVEQGRQFYGSHPDTRSFPPRFVHEWITRENVNALLQRYQFVGEIDLLSLDMDGVDYWIWDALEVIQPRVIVAEVQCIWGPDKAVTVPYDPEFRADYSQGFGIYCGASLSALTKLAASKGYRFVGTQRLGFNAFFVRNGLADDLLLAADPAACLDVPFVHWAREELLPMVKNRPWVEV